MATDGLNYWTSARNPSWIFGAADNGALYGSNDSGRPMLRNMWTYTAVASNAIWVKNRCTVVDNAVAAPDSTMTADKLVEDTSVTNSHYLSRATPVVVGMRYTTSVYVLAAERTWILIVAPAAQFGVLVSAYYDVANGALGNISANCLATITAVGGGWYRCTFTTPVASASGSALFQSARLALGNANASYTGDGVSGVYIWGAQCEEGTTVSTYQPITDGTTEYALLNPNPTIYQDSAATIPVSAYGQPIGKRLDERGGVTGNPAVQATAAARPLFASTPLRTLYDGVDDALVTTFASALGTDCTVGRAIPGVGAQILTAQNIGTTFTDTTTSACTFIISRALTAPETAQLTAFLNVKAGV